MDQNLSQTDAEVIKKSILEIRNLRKKLSSLKQKQNEPVAVIGMGCAFPDDASTPEEFWNLLNNKVDATGPPPRSRWELGNTAQIDYNKDVFRGGYLKRDIARFDPLFFDIPPKEAQFIDPQHRLFMEITWQALANAHIDPDHLNGSQTGVFCGITGNEYLQMIMTELPPDELNVYATTGNCLNFIAGRTSYILGLKGPSMAIDTACSSSLVAVHSACQSLRTSECDLAIAGGVNLILSPRTTLSLIQGNMLSSDGRCHTFGDKADGYARGEGCGVIILKRLSDAVEDKDHILAVLRNSRVKHDGKKSGLTVPRSESQKELMQETLQAADLKPDEMCYIEAHGTATSLGDPIELEALNAVYGRRRDPDNPLLIGSVKSNIGHLEAAAGIAGLIKVILSIHHKKIPPHLNGGKLNRHFDWEQSRLHVVRENMDWPVDKKRIAAVSSFGASGSNAHIIVEQTPETGNGEQPGLSAPAAGRDYKPQRYWYKDVFASDVKPVDERQIIKRPGKAEPFTFNEADYRFGLHIDAVKTIKEHRIFGTVVLTGSVYLDIALNLVNDMFPDHSIANYCFKNVSLLKPIIFEQDRIDLKATIEKIDYTGHEKLLRVKMFAAPGADNAPVEMFSSIDIQKLARPPVRVQPVLIDEIIGQCTEKMSGQAFYDRFWEKSFTIGRPFHIFEKVWREDGITAVGYCKPKDFIRTTGAYNLNPDSLIAYLNGLLFKGTLPEAIIRDLETGSQTFIGTGYDMCIFYETLQQEEIYCHARVTRHNDDHSQYNGDITIYANDGRVLCTMQNITFARIDQGAFPRLIEADMQRRPLDVPPPDRSTHPVMGAARSKIKTWTYNTLLDYHTYPLVGDHKAFNFALFPVIGFLELAIKAIRNVKPDFQFTRIDHLKVSQPVILHEGDRYKTKVTIGKQSGHEFSYAIYSFAAKKNIINKDWGLSKSGLLSDEPMVDEASAVFDKTIVDTFDEAYATKEFFDKFWGDDFYLGPSYHFLETIWRKPYESIGVIKNFNDYLNTIGIGEIPAYFLQIYMAAPLVMACVPDAQLEQVKRDEATYISAYVESFIIYDNNDLNAFKELWAHARIRNREDLGKKSISDFDYYNEDGQLVAKAVGVEFTLMEKKALELMKQSMDSIAARTDQAVDLRDFLETTVARITGIERAQLVQSTNLGLLMDSIMALELRNEIERNLAVLLPLNDIAQLDSIDDLYHDIKTRSGGVLK